MGVTSYWITLSPRIIHLFPWPYKATSQNGKVAAGRSTEYHLGLFIHLLRWGFTWTKLAPNSLSNQQWSWTSDPLAPKGWNYSVVLPLRPAHSGFFLAESCYFTSQERWLAGICPYHLNNVRNKTGGERSSRQPVLPEEELCSRTATWGFFLVQRGCSLLFWKAIKHAKRITIGKS